MNDFHELYEKNFKKVNYYLRSLCENSMLAEDLTQETFYKVLLFICSGKNADICTSWLIRIAHNVFIDYLRKNKIDLNNTVLPETEETAKSYDMENRFTLTSVLEKLPLRYKSIILLKDYYGFSYEEIEKIMNCSESSVRITLFRARNKFKEVYEKYERENPE